MKVKNVLPGEDETRTRLVLEEREEMLSQADR